MHLDWLIMKKIATIASRKVQVDSTNVFEKTKDIAFG